MLQLGRSLVTVRPTTTKMIRRTTARWARQLAWRSLYVHTVVPKGKAQASQPSQASSSNAAAKTPQPADMECDESLGEDTDEQLKANISDTLGQGFAVDADKTIIKRLAETMQSTANKRLELHSGRPKSGGMPEPLADGRDSEAQAEPKVRP